MKRLLVIRIPQAVSAERAQEIAEQIRSRVIDEFTVLVFGDKVDKTEVEIVYDPHFKAEQHDYQFEGSINPDAVKRMSQEVAREFLQVDTSTNAFMEGSLARDFDRVNSSDKK